MSVRRICFKTNFGFISIKEENEKVISINFKKSNNLSPNKLLFRLKSTLGKKVPKISICSFIFFQFLSIRVFL